MKNEVKKDCAFYDSKKKCVALKKDFAVCEGCRFYKTKKAYRAELRQIANRKE